MTRLLTAAALLAAFALYLIAGALFVKAWRRW